ncbi:MAG: HipA domain-containing protein [Eubacteriales bacterium]|nr:HipA domain-containing protein [Eubacteriales bacterium]
MKALIHEELYVLKHKDLDVALVYMDSVSGKLEYVIEVFLPEELPVGCNGESSQIAQWWQLRAIPDTRRGIQQVLAYMGEDTCQSLMLSGYGLSLTDHYWLQPVGEELYWKDINFYENAFSDEMGNLLTDSGRIDADRHISRFSPSSSVNGEMKKKWVIRNGKRYLLKVNANDYGQQSVNEVIAGRMHELLGWDNYVTYVMDKILIGGQEVPCSLNELFTSQDLEFVSAYQLVKNYKVPNEISEYEAVIQQAVLHGMEEAVVRRQLEYTILTDFVLSNTDRHYNNFGFLYSEKQRKLVAMAPIFDTGNSLYYNQEFIPAKSGLLDLKVTSFCKREVEMLRYVKEPTWFPIAKLEGLPEIAKQLLSEYTEMPEERIQKIVQTICRKIEYLQLFMDGRKIWKKEKYW